MSGEPTIYITTPIYYVNDRPHIGHAYTTVLADVMARYHRLLGRPTWFLTGTDEHGQKVQRAAERAGVSPQAHCDAMVVHFRRLWERLGISHDDFIRTTEPRHQEVVRTILQRLHRQGDIYPGEYEGYYCVHEENFWTEKDLLDGCCPDCRRPVERIAERNWFFRLSRHQDWLRARVEADPACVHPPSRRNEVLGFLRRPLADLCISRPARRLSWGIPLPFDEDYVCYVWFDALINYISAVGATADEGRFGRWWPAAWHIIGKDILVPSHAVYWPCMLRAAGIEPPRALLAHGWWLVDDRKMSKSLGNVTDPLDLVERYGADAFRYFLLREMVLGQDASFTADLFHRRYTADLANALGNLASRTLSMVERYRAGRVPAPGDAGEADHDLSSRAEALAAEAPALVDGLAFNGLLARTWELLSTANGYVERNRPWDLARPGGDGSRLDTVLYHLVEVLRVVSVLAWPVMPTAMGSLRERLGEGPVPASLRGEAGWGRLGPGRAVRKGEALFPRVEV
ncbi:MAG: methionine--tRNA ligase [Planctomycetes bacterium]|nr:methionine--tRNA ligase [Planctomycetota bacterium]